MERENNRNNNGGGICSSNIPGLISEYFHFRVLIEIFIKIIINTNIFSSRNLICYLQQIKIAIKIYECFYVFPCSLRIITSFKYYNIFRISVSVNGSFVIIRYGG